MDAEEERLVAALRRLSAHDPVRATDPVAGVADRVGARVRRRQRRRVGLAGAALCVAAAFGGWSLLGDNSEPSPTLDVVPGPTTPDPSVVPTTLEPGTGSSGFTGPSGRTATNAPGEVQPSVAPLPGVTELNPGPLARRKAAVVLDTGDQVIVWGGDIEGVNNGVAEYAKYDDGAVYDVATDSWQMMAAPPFDLDTPWSYPYPVGVWTGTEAIIFRSGEAAAYSPATNSWRLLAPPPKQVNGAVWVDGRLVALGPNAIYDPVIDQWRPISGIPAVDVLQKFVDSGRAQLVATDTHAVVLYMDGIGARAVEALRIDPAAGVATALPSGPLPAFEQVIDALALTNGRVLVAGYQMSVIELDPITARWRELPSLPIAFSEGSPVIAESPSGEVAILRSPGIALLEDDTWRVAPELSWIFFPWPSGPVAGEYHFGIRASLANGLTRLDVAEMVRGQSTVALGLTGLPLTDEVAFEAMRLERDDQGFDAAIELDVSVAGKACSLRREGITGNHEAPVQKGRVAVPEGALRIVIQCRETTTAQRLADSLIPWTP